MPSLGYSMMPFLLNARFINVVNLGFYDARIDISFLDSLDFNKIWLIFWQLHDWDREGWDFESCSKMEMRE